MVITFFCDHNYHEHTVTFIIENYLSSVLVLMMMMIMMMVVEHNYMFGNWIFFFFG